MKAPDFTGFLSAAIALSFCGIATPDVHQEVIAAEDLELLFRRGARAGGSSYPVHRDMLLRDRGALAEALPRFELRTAEESLFRDLLELELEDPDRVSLLRMAIQMPFQVVERGDAWTVRYSGPTLNHWRATGESMPDGEVVQFSPDIAPVAFDVLRSNGANIRGAASRNIPTLFVAFADPRIAEFALEESCRRRRSMGSVGPILEEVGPPSIPLMVRVLERCVDDEPADTTAAWMLHQTALEVIGTAERLHDESILSPLRRVLEHSERAELVAACIKTLTTIDPEGSVATYVKRLQQVALETSSDSRIPTYGAVRPYCSLFGSPILAALEAETRAATNEQRSLLQRIRESVEWELANADAATEFYGSYDRHRTGEPNLLFGARLFWDQDTTPVHIPPVLLRERLTVRNDPKDLILAIRAGAIPDAEVIHRVSKLDWDRLGPRLTPDLLDALASPGEFGAILLIHDALQTCRLPGTAIELLGFILSYDPSSAHESAWNCLDRIGALEAHEQRHCRDLEEVARHLVETDPHDLAALLQCEHPTIRHQTAVYQMREGEALGVYKVLQGCLTTTGFDHFRLRRRVLENAEIVRPLLDGFVLESSDSRAATLARGLELELDRPEVVERITSFGRSHRGFAGRAGPTASQVREAGRALATQVGDDALPLLESALLFGAFGVDHQDSRLWPGPEILTFAIAAVGNPRSIPLLLQVSDSLRVYRDGGVLSLALPEFGAAGLEVAADLPAPDPQLQNYGGRAGRHRGGAMALIEANDPRAVEKLVEAFESLLDAPTDSDSENHSNLRRATSLLQETMRLSDERLVAPLTKLTELPWLRQDRDVLDLIYEVLCRQPEGNTDDVSVAVWRDAGHLSDYGVDHAVTLLLRCHGDAFDRLETAIDPVFTDSSVAAQSALHGHARALANLGLYGALHLQLAHLHMESPMDEEQRNQLASTWRQRATSMLIRLLPLVPDRHLAQLLSRLANNHGQAATVDPDAHTALVQWIRSANQPHSEIFDVLAERPTPQVEAASLEVLERHGWRYAPCLAYLGQHATEAAVPALRQVWDTHVEDDRFSFEAIRVIEALAAAGPTGHRQLEQLFEQTNSLRQRSLCATHLAAHSTKEEIHAKILTLLEEVVDEGLWHPGICDRSQPRETTLRYSFLDLHRAAGSVALARVRELDDEWFLRDLPPVLRIALLEEIARLNGDEPRNHHSHTEMEPWIDQDSDSDTGSASGRCYELWWRTTTQSSGDVAPPHLARKLITQGPVALRTLLHLMRPMQSLKPEELRPALESWVAGSESPLLWTDWRATALEHALVTRGETEPWSPLEQVALADLRRLRHVGPWFVDDERDLRRVAYRLLDEQWPLDQLRLVAREERALLESLAGHPLVDWFLLALHASTAPEDRTALDRYRESEVAEIGDTARRIDQHYRSRQPRWARPEDS